jgi:hypothetical protein
MSISRFGRTYNSFGNINITSVNGYKRNSVPSRIDRCTKNDTSHVSLYISWELIGVESF